MAVVLVTGMSGVGKTSALGELARRGHRVVETDDDGWTTEVAVDGAEPEPVWREDRIDVVLTSHTEGHLFISGCVRNQGRFSPRFDAVVLLRAPLDVVLQRVATRTTNDFGKAAGERDRIIRDVAEVEPQLRAGATAEIDTRAPLGEVVERLEAIAAGRPAGRAREGAGRGPGSC